MRGKQQTVVLTVEEIEAIRDEAADSAGGFTLEDLKAMREQYEERLAAERNQREDLEWRLRMAAARLRDVTSVAEKLRAMQESLKGLLGEIFEEEKAPKDPVRRITPPPTPPRALRKDFKRALA
jgi:chromosome segregation ATPase